MTFTLNNLHHPSSIPGPPLVKSRLYLWKLDGFAVPELTPSRNPLHNCTTSIHCGMSSSVVYPILLVVLEVVRCQWS